MQYFTQPHYYYYYYYYYLRLFCKLPLHISVGSQ